MRVRTSISSLVQNMIIDKETGKQDNTEKGRKLEIDRKKICKTES